MLEDRTSRYSSDYSELELKLDSKLRGTEGSVSKDALYFVILTCNRQTPIATSRKLPAVARLLLCVALHVPLVKKIANNLLKQIIASST